jgi:hypothetical protein
MVKYTKYGNNRYKILFFDERQNHIRTISENINNKNVIDKMDEFGVSMSQWSWINASDRKWHKEHINKEGFYPINEAGYLAVTENVNYGTYRKPNYRIIFVDMIQLDKLLKINLFSDILIQHLA